MKSKRFSGLAKIWVWALLMTSGAAFAGGGLQTENGEPPVLPPGKHFGRVLVIVLEVQNYSSAIRDGN
jgi:hypothetical protein